MRTFRTKVITGVIALIVFGIIQMIFDPIYPIQDCVWWKIMGKALLRVFYGFCMGTSLYVWLGMRRVGSRIDKHH